MRAPNSPKEKPGTCRRISPSITQTAWIFASAALLSGCTTVGSMMSPYSEKFSCKNSDHGQCIHPDKAYADAVANRASRSEPGVTRDKALLGAAKVGSAKPRDRRTRAVPGAYQGYRDSVYRELQGLIEAPVTPMLRQPRTVRTLILPYADEARPDRLYMPRYIFSLLDQPQWVIADYLVDPVSKAARAPILDQVKDDAEAIHDVPEGSRP